MFIRVLAIMGIVSFLSACATTETNTTATAARRLVTPNPSLVGAWEVTVKRARGVGKNLLTFSSDGTFFRSGDTHPILSGGHGAWKLTGPNQYNASYVAFSFDTSGKWIGVNRNNLQIVLGPDGNEFEGTVKSSYRDLEDKEVRTGTSPLAGKRIQVQPF